MLAFSFFELLHGVGSFYLASTSLSMPVFWSPGPIVAFASDCVYHVGGLRKSLDPVAWERKVVLPLAIMNSWWLCSWTSPWRKRLTVDIWTHSGCMRLRALSHVFLWFANDTDYIKIWADPLSVSVPLLRDKLFNSTLIAFDSWRSFIKPIVLIEVWIFNWRWSKIGHFFDFNFSKHIRASSCIHIPWLTTVDRLLLKQRPRHRTDSLMPVVNCTQRFFIAKVHWKYLDAFF